MWFWSCDFIRVDVCGVEVEFFLLSTHLHVEGIVYGMTGEGGLPLVHASEAGELDGRRPAGVTTEVISTDSGVPLQAHAVIQGVFVLEDNIHGCDVVCACGVGRGVAAVAAVEASIVAAVREGNGAEPGELAAVAVGHRSLG